MTTLIMMSRLNMLLLVIAITFVVAFAATWVVRELMRKLGIMDVPTEDSRKAHGRPVAYEGGLAMWVAIIVGLLASMYFIPELFLHLREYEGLIIGASLIVAIGAADDIMDMRPVFKLAAQLGVGALMFYYGFRIEKISNPFGEELVFWSGLSLAGTCLWYGLLINGINMIDGMDGLASGIVAISAVTLGAIAWDLDTPFAVVLCAVLLASCLGFLPWNFSPATIFMGDAGSMLLGFMLASITLLSSSKAPAFLALIIPMLAVGVPLFETVFAFTRRLLQGKHPFRADRRHLHHRFLALGFTERRTVLTFYYITAYFGVTAYVLQKLEAGSTLPLVFIVGVGMLVLIENMRFLEKKRLVVLDAATRIPAAEKIALQSQARKPATQPRFRSLVPERRPRKRR
jgi:UDP-GlcNAc:undecaprenyl-phosphate GlcNAc-1-phosphate transferase